MAGRNDRAIADALHALSQAVGNQNTGMGAGNFNWLERFQRNKPPSFKGRYDPDGAQNWLREVEKIFRAMGCPDTQKVILGTYMLAEEAEYWWENTQERVASGSGAITWEAFKGIFLEKYFPEDMRNRKEMEFLELKQGSMTVAEYVAKFEELSRFFPHYHGAAGERSKCVKFINGLRPEIKQAVNYQEIHQFSVLANRCRIYDEDRRARVAHYKDVGPMKTKTVDAQDRPRPYPAPSNHASHRDGSQRLAANQPVNGENGVSFFTRRCGKCGRTNHATWECKDAAITCFNCKKQGHMERHCPNLKKEQWNGRQNSQANQPQATGRPVGR